MSKLRSRYEFIARLDSEAAWRKHEITRVQAALVNANGHWESSLVRMGIVMLCAHWEGFVKAAASTYLEFVSQQIITKKLSFDDLSPHFRALSLWKAYNAAQSAPVVAFTETIGSYFGSAQLSPRFQTTGLVSTKSNLTAKRFRLILRTIGLKDTQLEARALVIQEQIVKKRHAIAHGGFYGSRDRGAPISATEYAALTTDLFKGLDEFRDILENAAVSMAYRTPAPTSAPSDVASPVATT